MSILHSMKQTPEIPIAASSLEPMITDSNILAYDALMQREFSWTDEPIAESYSQEIFFMHKVAREISQARVMPFYMGEGSRRHPVVMSNALGYHILKILSIDFPRIRAEYPKHEFSPVFTFWEYAAAQLPPDDLYAYFDRRKPIEKQRSLLTFIFQKLKTGRCFLRSENFKSKNDNFRRVALGNFQSLTTSIKHLTQHRATATVLRFDLYRPNLEDDAGNLLETKWLESSQEFVDCHKRFHRSMDRWLGPALCGYAWNISYRPVGGFRVHYLVFLDSEFDSRVGAALVDDLGDRWRNQWRKKWEIRVGVNIKGGVYNGNAHPDRYQFPVLDKVRLNDGATVTGLQLIASYMTHAALFIKLKLEDNRDVFSKGRFPGEPVRTRGRPPRRPHGDWIEIAPTRARNQKFNYF